MTVHKPYTFLNFDMGTVSVFQSNLYTVTMLVAPQIQNLNNFEGYTAIKKCAFYPSAFRPEGYCRWLIPSVCPYVCNTSLSG